jgi:hypothetical protein
LIFGGSCARGTVLELRVSLQVASLIGDQNTSRARKLIGL